MAALIDLLPVAVGALLGFGFSQFGKASEERRSAERARLLAEKQRVVELLVCLTGWHDSLRTYLRYRFLDLTDPVKQQFMQSVLDDIATVTSAFDRLFAEVELLGPRWLIDRGTLERLEEHVRGNYGVVTRVIGLREEGVVDHVERLLESGERLSRELIRVSREEFTPRRRRLAFWKGQPPEPQELP
ncbi:hypothetical protein [Nocardioides nanhaiensis]|uniref:Uncharacterized protein n=1 Tax=Nocardioides nanhaiensis TaxID=1476871 RepID=A0ABP8WZU5_9ACTN